jgi:hypothetical protein
MQIENCKEGAMQIVLDLITLPLYGRGRTAIGSSGRGQKTTPADFTPKKLSIFPKN